MDVLDHGRGLPTVESVYRYAGTGFWWEDYKGWRVLWGVERARDGRPLDESNFISAQRILDDAGAVYETHRIGHWGVGWYEIIFVAPDDVSIAAAGGIVASLADYPVLDEEDCGAREYENQIESWSSWGASEYVDALPLSHEEAKYATESYLLYVGPHAAPGMRYVEQGSDGPHFVYDRLTRDETAALVRAALRWKRERRAEKGGLSNAIHD